jgi:hypothetical protein
MFKRTLTALALGLTLAAVAPAQEPDDLQLNKRSFQDKEAIQAQAVLRLPAARPELAGPDRRAHYQHVAVQAALDWMVRHGYLFHDDSHSIEVYNTSQGLVMVIHFAGGGNAVIYLGPGPFLPRPEPEVERLDTLMTVTILRDLRVQEPVFNP